MKQILIPLIFLLAGLLTGYFFQSDKAETISIESNQIQITKEEYSKLKESSQRATELNQKVQSLSEINLEEYVTLKDQREKYLKADELFGKVMLLFLADLSLHMNESVQDWANQSSEERRENFERVFTNERQESTPPAETTTSFSESYELSEDQDQRQFEREQILNAKKPFQGRLSFRDKLGRSMKNMMDSRVVRELWGKEVWKGETQPIQFDQLVYYEVRRKGFFRRGKKTQAKMDFRLEIDENKDPKKKFKTRLKISIKNSKRFYFHFDDRVEALHPANHNKFGKGPCRGVILKGEKGILVYLSYLRDFSGKPDNKLIVGRLIDTRLKNPILGNFLLEKSE